MCVAEGARQSTNAVVCRPVENRGIPGGDRISSRRTGPRHPGSRARLARCRPGVEAMERRQLLATFSVINNSPAGTGSLRQAIIDANGSMGLDTIDFRLPGGQTTITPGAMNNGPLPTITGPVILDGATQAGYTGTPVVTIDGSGAGGDGLRLSGGASTVRGLAIVNSAGAGIRIDTLGNDLIVANHIGVNTAGTGAGQRGQGIFVSTAGNTIGGTVTDGNVISGNAGRHPALGHRRRDQPDPGQPDRHQPHRHGRVAQRRQRRVHQRRGHQHRRRHDGRPDQYYQRQPDQRRADPGGVGLAEHHPGQPARLRRDRRGEPGQPQLRRAGRQRGQQHDRRRGHRRRQLHRLQRRRHRPGRRRGSTASASSRPAPGRPTAARATRSSATTST